MFLLLMETQPLLAAILEDVFVAVVCNASPHNFRYSLRMGICNGHEVDIMFSFVGQYKFDVNTLNREGLTQLVARNSQSATVIWRQLPAKHQYLHQPLLNGFPPF